MAKALELNADTLTVMPSVPRAAQVKSLHAAEQAGQGRAPGKSAGRIGREPLQIRWPVEEVKAAKLAAIQMDFGSVSDFMLACFQAYMKDKKA